MPENTLWQGINFQLLSHPSYWMKVTVSICKMTLLSSLSSLLSSHPPHQGMSQRIWHLGGEGGERQEEIERGGEEQRWGRLERWVDQYLRETWEDVAWPFLPVSLKRRHKNKTKQKTNHVNQRADGAGALAVEDPCGPAVTSHCSSVTNPQLRRAAWRVIWYTTVSYALSWNSIT